MSLVRKYDHGTFAGATEHVEKRCAKSAPKADLVRYGMGFRELVLMLPGWKQMMQVPTVRQLWVLVVVLVVCQYWGYMISSFHINEWCQRYRILYMSILRQGLWLLCECSHDFESSFITLLGSGKAEVLPCFKPCKWGRRAPKTVLHVGTLMANEGMQRMLRAHQEKKAKPKCQAKKGYSMVQ